MAILILASPIASDPLELQRAFMLRVYVPLYRRKNPDYNTHSSHKPPTASIIGVVAASVNDTDL